MDASENRIQPVRGSAQGTALPTVFAGTVTGVTRENGVQSVEIRFSQGRVKLEAEGEFQAGEKIKLTFQGNGSVQLEKGAPSGLASMTEAGYTLPKNLSTLKDLRAFEENVSNWMAAKGMTGMPDSEAGAAGSKTAEALRNTSLPQLLMQAMGEEGGKEFLAENLPALHRGVVSALMDALQESEGDAGTKTSLIDLLKSLGKPAAAGAGTGGAGSAAAFMQGEAGAGHAPWFGRIMDKSQADGFLTPMQRLQFGGGVGAGGAPPKSDPAYRYVLDMGGRTMEVYSSQSLETGEFADFALERQGGRVQARFSDPAASLPPALKTDMAGASAEMRKGMLLASHYLEDFKGEPYYGKLVKEFGEVLAQSGAMDARTAEGKTGIPDRKDLDGLLKLFVSYPRDTEHPERQAKVWGDALKDPQAMMRLLKNVKPEQESSLLRSGTPLQLSARDLPGAVEELLGRVAKGEEKPEAAAAWLKKMLPESFHTGDLLKLAADGAPGSAASKDHDAAKFLLQAVANGFPREDQIPEGKPAQFYFYQGQEWRNLQVTWKRDDGGEGKGKAGPKAPLQVRVETKAKNMGQVNVAVSWEPKGAKLDFRNQFHDVRDLLGKSLPELEKSLSLLDFKISAWSYQMLPPDAASAADPGWTRPAGLSDGANLDLFG
jgi:hypothetical protein